MAERAAPQEGAPGPPGDAPAAGALTERGDAPGAPGAGQGTGAAGSAEPAAPAASGGASGSATPAASAAATPAASAELAAAAAAAPAPADAVWLAHRETRTALGKPGGGKRGYSLRFHLVAASGAQLLAATGEDQGAPAAARPHGRLSGPRRGVGAVPAVHRAATTPRVGSWVVAHGSRSVRSARRRRAGRRAGDAHYTYRGVRDFPGRPAVECHNRRELTAWLDAVVHDSQGGAPADAPPSMPPFVAYRCPPAAERPPACPFPGGLPGGLPPPHATGRQGARGPAAGQRRAARRGAQAGEAGAGGRAAPAALVAGGRGRRRGAGGGRRGARGARRALRVPRGTRVCGRAPARRRQHGRRWRLAGAGAAAPGRVGPGPARFLPFCHMQTACEADVPGVATCEGGA